MAKTHWFDDRSATFGAAQLFVERCLATDGSLFTPESPIWTLDVIEEAAEGLLPVDTRKAGYMEKLKPQVAGFSPPAVQFTAEVLYVQLLPIDEMASGKKRAVVDEILGWMPDPAAIPPDLVRGLGAGIATYGAGNAQRDRYVKYLVRFALAWKRATDEQRRSALADPWKFREFVYAESGQATMQREALLYLVFPHAFEDVLAPSDKASAAKAFASLPGIAGATDTDHELAAVRSALTPILGEKFSLYDDTVRPIWSGPSVPEWDGLVTWSARLYTQPDFDAEERDYKLVIAGSLAEAREALRNDGDWFAPLKAALRAKVNNLIPWQNTDSFLKWCEREPEAAHDTLARLWSGDEPDIEGFLDDLPDEAAATDGARLALASNLLYAVDATRYPMFRATPFDRASSLLGRETSSLRGAKRYSALETLLDELRVRLLVQGVALRDRLDAQSLLWWAISGDPPEDWSDADKAAFLAFRERGTRPDPDNPEEPKRAWFIRGANVDGANLVPEWLEDGYASIGWSDVGPLLPGISRVEITERVRDAQPQDSAGAIRMAVGNLDRFVNKIEPGDLVVTTNHDDVYVGRITGDPTFDPQTSTAAARRRAVEWLNAANPESRASVGASAPGLYSRLKTLLTVTNLTDELRAVLRLARGDVGTEPRTEPTLPDATDDLSDSLLLPKNWLQDEVISLLREKRQLIFYGPPGTGKTYVARAIAEHVTSTGGEVELVQFHPSYGYEDFFEGFRPAQSEDGLGIVYELTPGPLRRIAKAAIEDPSRPYVLIIDEINRGNVPKIFGELLFLLEYRDEGVPLLYSPEEQFRLPPNLLVIGTMNTADRSIALVDAALRRRFYFVPFMPREAPVRDVLGLWLDRSGVDPEPAKLLDLLNLRIADNEIAIGPSYLITRDGSAPNLERVWRHAILPLLEEHYYGTGRDVEEEFGLSALRKSLATASDGALPAVEIHDEA